MRSAYILFSDEIDDGDVNNNKNKITVWKNIKEMDFNRKEFQKYVLVIINVFRFISMT